MNVWTRNALLGGCAILIANTVARAQSLDPIGDILTGVAQDSAPSRGLSKAQTVAEPLSAADQAHFAHGLAAAQRGDVSRARNAINAVSDRIARKTIAWALIDTSASSLSFSELDAARRDLESFPRPSRRQIAAERGLDGSGLSPSQIVDWFAGQQPQSAQGAIALATALRSLGNQTDSINLVRAWWRDKSFEADAQRTMLIRFPDGLSVDDHIRRADILLYGAQGPATRDVIALLPADQKPAALARIALRSDGPTGDDAYAGLTPEQQSSPGVAYERAASLRRRGRETEAMALLPLFPRDMVTANGAERMWDDRHRLTLLAIRANDWWGAYAAAANSGISIGTDATEAEFYAGWIALNRLNDPKTAATHFAAIDRIGTSPITKGRAYFWQGRAAESQGDQTAATAFYERGAEHGTTFYGQLSSEKLGRPLVLPRDPVANAAERAAFERKDSVQAMRLLMDQGQRDLFRAFALHLDDTLPTAVEIAMLVDAIRSYGDQDTSMKAARSAATRGLILADRAYPLRFTPAVPGAPEPALVLGITRQESGFDPSVRSHADARGMMQLLPSTASSVARRMGVSFSPARLYEAEYNMQLGSSFLGQLVDRFSGSYIMAAAGYNAGPGRLPQWSVFCGDPRAGSSDPLDFIECIPFGETRNYVMRVLENMQVYRAKMNGGSIPITLSQDLRRGAYAYAATDTVVTTTNP